MNTTEIMVIASVLAAISLTIMFYVTVTSSKVKNDKPVASKKLEAGKISFPHCVDSTDVEKPIRKKKRYYNKKKPAVANNTTVVKKPVGRPKKSK